MQHSFSLKIIVLLWIAIVLGCTNASNVNDLQRKYANTSPSPSPAATVQQSGWKPQEACDYLSDVNGLQTRGYKNQFESTFGCSSPYKELEETGVKANNIAYYVQGNSQQANELKLVLNVNSPKSSKEAHAALLQYSDQLTQKSLNASMPNDAKQAITSGKAGKWTLGKATIELLRENWPTGKGYELKYSLRKE